MDIGETEKVHEITLPAREEAPARRSIPTRRPEEQPTPTKTPEKVPAGPGKEGD